MAVYIDNHGLWFLKFKNSQYLRFSSYSPNLLSYSLIIVKYP
jgi:hypothetical protein